MRGGNGGTRVEPRRRRSGAGAEGDERQGSPGSGGGTIRGAGGAGPADPRAGAPGDPHGALGVRERGLPVPPAADGLEQGESLEPPGQAGGGWTDWGGEELRRQGAEYASDADGAGPRGGGWALEAPGADQSARLPVAAGEWLARRRTRSRRGPQTSDRALPLAPPATPHAGSEGY